MNSLKLRDLAAAWYFVEKFHTRPPTAMRTIQKTALLIVEFTLIPPRTAGSFIDTGGTAGSPEYDRSLTSRVSLRRGPLIV
jgi:hypothetical protein